MTMTRGELQLLHTYLHKSVSYLEFGAGESTVYAAALDSLKNIDCVESSPVFVEEKVLPHPVVQQSLASGKLHFHFIDLGETGDWGHPVNEEKKHLWPEYSTAVFREKRKYDLVLIDGRFRVACTLQSLLQTDPGCLIVMHDFWNREPYHVVLRYLDVVDQADTMAVFTQKPNLDLRKIKADIRRYTFLPDDKTWAYRLRKRAPQKVFNWLKSWFGKGG